MRDLTFRYSMIGAAHFCLEKANLQYIQKIPVPGKQSALLAFGSAFHIIPETYFDGEDPIAAFRMYWSSIDPDTLDWTKSRQKYDELGQIGEELARKWLKAHAKHYKPYHVVSKIDTEANKIEWMPLIEREVTFRLNNFKLTGKPDFIGYYKDVLSIVDWKTSGSDFDKNRVHTDSQMWLYVHAAKQVYDLNIEQIVYAPFVKYQAKVQNPVCLEVTQGKLKKMLDNCTLVMQNLSTNKEFPRNESNCLRCEYLNYCYKEIV